MRLSTGFIASEEVIASLSWSHRWTLCEDIGGTVNHSAAP